MMSSKQPNHKEQKYIVHQLAQKLSARTTKFKSSFYAGTTVKQFLEKLEQDDEDLVDIKINRTNYDPMIHDYLLVKKYKVKQELIKKKFKEKIVIHLGDPDDILKIAEDVKEFKETYGYVVKIVINITTES